MSNSKKHQNNLKSHDGVLVHIVMLAHTWTTTMLIRYVDLVHNNHCEGCMRKHPPPTNGKFVTSHKQYFIMKLMMFKIAPLENPYSPKNPKQPTQLHKSPQ